MKPQLIRLTAVLLLSALLDAAPAQTPRVIQFESETAAVSELDGVFRFNLICTPKLQSGEEVAVKLSLLPATASPGRDFATASGEYRATLKRIHVYLPISPPPSGLFARQGSGESWIFRVLVSDDGIPKPDETFIFMLSAPKPGYHSR